MYNQDGSEGRIAGNAIRCVVKYVYDNNIVKKDVITVETLSGVRECKVITKMGVVTKVTVNIGKVELNPEKVPVKLKGERVVDREITIGDIDYNVTCLSVGNPHCVVFTNSVDKLDLEAIGPKFAASELFPEGINTGFVEVIDEKTLRIRVWERGSGETMSCGTGACAAAVAAVLNGYCKKGTDIRVIVKGGNLTINYTDDAILMTGDAAKVYEGVFEI